MLTWVVLMRVVPAPLVVKDARRVVPTAPLNEASPEAVAVKPWTPELAALRVLLKAIPPAVAESSAVWERVVAL